MIIDVHGHYTTAPKALETWRNAQIAGIADAALMPKAADLRISDDEIGALRAACIAAAEQQPGVKLRS